LPLTSERLARDPSHDQVPCCWHDGIGAGAGCRNC
jgi:hypothetical protein